MSTNSNKNTIRKNFLHNLFGYLFRIFIFLIPTQLGLHFWPSWSFVYGIRIDYLSPTIYLTDVLIFLIIFYLLFVKRNFKIFYKTKKSALLILLFIAINLLISSSVYPSLFKWIKYVEMFLLGVCIAKNIKSRTVIYFIHPLILSIVFFVILGLVQIINKGTIGGLAYFLGERSFTTSTPGIALVRILGNEYLRAYSTFPHPNAFSGFLAVGLFIIFQYKKYLNKNWFLFGLIFSLLGIAISFSKTTFTAIIISILFYVLIKHFDASRKLILSCIFISIVSSSLLLFAVNENSMGRILESQSVRERMSLISVSKKMFSNNVIFGIGLNNFTVNIPKYSINRYWNIQPVHNIFLLILIETGIFGLVVFYYYSEKLLRINNFYIILPLLFIMLSGFNDHYWLTIQQNLIILTVAIGLVLKDNSNKI